MQVSATGVDEEPDASRGDVWVAYLHAKRAAEEALRASSLDWTILRPGRLTDDPGVGKVLLAPSVPRGAVTRDDTAAVLAALLDAPGTGRADTRAGRGRRRRARRRRRDRPSPPRDDSDDDTDDSGAASPADTAASAPGEVGPRD